MEDKESRSEGSNEDEGSNEESEHDSDDSAPSESTKKNENSLLHLKKVQKNVNNQTMIS